MTIILKRLINKIKRILNRSKRKKPVMVVKCFIHPTAIIEDFSTLHLHPTAEIWEGVIIRSGVELTLGANVQIGPYTVIFGGNKITIDENVIIAPHCVIAAGNHDYVQISTPMRFANSISKGPIIIEKNVWIGANVTITDNVVIGEEAVVAANSVVTKSVNAFAIVAGVPAKQINFRKNKK